MTDQEQRSQKDDPNTSVVVAGSWWLFVVGVVILAALFITCVTVLLCKRKKGESTCESFRGLYMKQIFSSEPSNKSIFSPQGTKHRRQKM